MLIIWYMLIVIYYTHLHYQADAESIATGSCIGSSLLDCPTPLSKDAPCAMRASLVSTWWRLSSESLMNILPSRENAAFSLPCFTSCLAWYKFSLRFVQFSNRIRIRASS